MADAPVITVVGEGEDAAVPDRCHVTLALNVMAPTVVDAVTQVGELASRVTERLRDRGIAEADRQTVALSVQDFFDPKEQAVTARVGSYVLVVKAPIGDVGPLLAAVASVAGDSLQVRGSQLAVSNVEPHRAAARRRAVDDAMARASELADAAGVRLGALVSLEELPVRALVPGPYRVMAARAAGPVPDVAVEGGTHAVTVNVTATFAVEA